MGNQEAEGDVPENSPKEKSGSESGSAKWIKDITAFVALLGTIVGVAISIWGLVEKSKVDKETAQQAARQAEINRGIAEAQIAAHRAEYEFQGQQHDKDRMYQDQEHQREQQIAEAQRLSTIIDGLFSGAANSEGKIDLLSAYVTPDHRNDSIIANALIAKLDNPQSHAEIAAALSVLEKLEAPRSRYLIIINQNARSRYNEALVSLYWRFLDARISQVGKSDVTSTSRDLTGISPGRRLVNIVAQSEKAFSNESYSPLAIFDQLYIYATINSRIVIPLIDDILPGADDKHSKENDPLWWNEIQEAVHAQVLGDETQQLSQFLLAGDILKKTSEAIPRALLEEGRAVQKSTIILKSCYLGDATWPEGRYPTIDFGNSFVRGSDFRKAILDSGTVSSLLHHTRIIQYEKKSDPYGIWNSTGQLEPLTNVFKTSSDDLSDVKLSPALISKVQTLQAKASSGDLPESATR